MGKAIELGIGLGAMPDYFAHGNPNLQRVACNTAGPCYEVYLCYAEAMRGSKRVAVFRDFLVSQARDWAF
jgi:DNA-binding transcriptional LysR family regulator